MSASAISLIASGAFIGLVLVAHALKPEIDPRWRMLSELAIGRWGIVMNIAFVAWSMSNITLAIALRPFVPSWTAVLLVVVSLGPLGAAFARTDPITTPPTEATIAGRWHAFFGLLFILGFPLVTALLAITAIVAASPLGPWLAGLGSSVWACIATFVVLVARWRREGRTAGSQMPIGWPNRLFVLAYAAWTIGVALATQSLPG